jgi:hypothetical protein
MTFVLAQALVTACAGLAYGAENRINDRKERQQKRIAEGIADGDLTAREAAKLEKKEAELARDVRQDRRDGGKLTVKERVKIENRQDKLSGQIFKEKHDKQKRK